MICSLSGETPQEPVVSKKSGHVFEKRLIEKWLDNPNNNGLCPVTHEPLANDDLVPIKVNKVVKPRPTTATSVPGLLQIFQNEWDALMLETYSLKQQLESVRQELSHSLYQHHAACRVIARLIRERDEARNTLSNFRANSANGQPTSGSSEHMELERQPGLPDDVRQRIESVSKELSSGRKKRPIPSSLATADEIKTYNNNVSSNNYHSSSSPGVLCVDVHPVQDNLIITGGNDGNVVISDRNTKKIVTTLKDHSKKVNDVLHHFREPIVLSASSDKTAKVWNTTEGKCVHTLQNHSEEVVSVSLHPTGDYVATASADHTWALHDLQSGATLLSAASETAFRVANFHPDGALLGSGNHDSVVRVWDVKTGKEAARFLGHTTGRVIDLVFSENGYYLATAGDDNTIRMWDLRKSKNFHTLDLNDTGLVVSALDFDYSGSYLAAAVGNEIRVYIGRTLGHIVSLEKHTDRVTGVAWGHDAKFIASSSLDRSLKLWSTK